MKDSDNPYASATSEEPKKGGAWLLVVFLVGLVFVLLFAMGFMWTKMDAARLNEIQARDVAVQAQIMAEKAAEELRAAQESQKVTE